MTIGGGELQAGLKLGLGSGDVRVTSVQQKNGGNVGFEVDTAAADFFYIVTTTSDNMCSDGKSYAGAQPIVRVDFCTGGSGCL